MATLFESNLKEYPLMYRGKVRDVYDLGENVLIVTSDRISAFDVIMQDPIPGKGEVLTGVTLFWLKQFQDLVKTQVSGKNPLPKLEDLFSDQHTLELLKGRSMIVKKAKPLPVECIVRGYLIGTGYKDYLSTGSVCGIKLPAGLQMASKLPEAIFTPSSKAEQGAHDENITFDEMTKIVGRELADKIKSLSLMIYTKGAEFAATKGIIIADTKFEFGLVDDELVLIDEVLTPDSSRFWPKEGYREGISPPSFDKQFLRDYLETLTWDKKAPAPRLPQEIVQKTSDKYNEIKDILTS